ncbi:MAG: ATP-dependent Clp protease proteolytic subunit [Thaumarchaeota archaeon]|jgi:ClpP class serine protease|nr:ATP-dependent Clp protease proteolytic subunit [Nitrososphaerota archaeon]
MDGIDIGILFWLFLLLLIFLWPQYKQKALQGARLSLIRKLEHKLGCRVVTLIHRQERIGLFGIPFYRYIDIEDSEHVLRAIRMTPPDMPIAIIIHTPGGLVLAAAQIALALKEHKAKKIAIIPHYAMSGGTLIALAADEIWMDVNAVLGPVDPQISDPRHGAIPAASILKVVKEKGRDKVREEYLLLADIAEKAMKQMEDLVYKLLRDKLGDEKAKEIARIMVEGRWTHDYPITVEEARSLGIPVKTEIPAEVYHLMELYPQPAAIRPSVEYVPAPYAPPRTRRGEQQRR